MTDDIEVTSENQIEVMLYDTLVARDRLQERVAELERKDAEWRRVSIKQSNELYAQKIQRDKIELSADAPAQQTQISDEAVEAALVVFYKYIGISWPLEREDENGLQFDSDRMRAAITAANEWGK